MNISFFQNFFEVRERELYFKKKLKINENFDLNKNKNINNLLLFSHIGQSSAIYFLTKLIVCRQYNYILFPYLSNIIKILYKK